MPDDLPELPPHVAARLADPAVRAELAGLVAEWGRRYAAFLTDAAPLFRRAMALAGVMPERRAELCDAPLVVAPDGP